MGGRKSQKVIFRLFWRFRLTLGFGTFYKPSAFAIVGDVVARTIPAKGGRFLLMNSPLAYTISEASAVARVGRTALYEAIRSGALSVRKRGRRSIVSRSRRSP